VLGSFARGRRTVRARLREAGGGTVAFVALAVVVLALAGCGGSSAVTKAQYVAKVNAICTTEQNEMTQLALSSTKIFAKIAEASQIRERTLAKIESVKTPASEAISPEWLELRHRALAVTKKLAALPPGSHEARALNREFITSTNKAQAIATRYGLTACRAFATT
jgi:hypothetical protein